MNDHASEFAIDLEPAESAILAGIELDPRRIRYENAQTNGSAVVKLMRLLVKRGAIPEVRAKYWHNPEYHHGRVKASHKGLFERNGNQGEEIYEHPHFLKYLRYFLCGADLPADVIAALKAKVGNPDWLSSSDIVPLAKFARTLARQSWLDHSTSEEFYKLALDLGLPLYTAGAIRKAVAQIR
jgi:predicted dehydrogenase